MTSTFPRKTILCIDNDVNVIDAFVSKDEASRSLVPVIARVCSEDPCSEDLCAEDLPESGNPESRPENMPGHQPASTAPIGTDRMDAPFSPSVWRSIRNGTLHF